MSSANALFPSPGWGRGGWRFRETFSPLRRPNAAGGRAWADASCPAQLGWLATDHRLVPVSRFIFRLEQVRALREQAERQAKEALALQLAVVARHESAVSDVRLAVEAARVTSGPALGQPVLPHELLARQAYVERLDRNRQAAELRLAREETEAGARRSLLEVAARDREGLERVKKRAAETHRVAAARAADEEMGEVALTTFRRAAAQGQA
jgi:flagellar export protein FliJ